MSAAFSSEDKGTWARGGVLALRWGGGELESILTFLQDRQNIDVR